MKSVLLACASLLVLFCGGFAALLVSVGQGKKEKQLPYRVSLLLGGAFCTLLFGLCLFILQGKFTFAEFFHCTKIVFFGLGAPVFLTVVFDFLKLFKGEHQLKWTAAVYYLGVVGSGWVKFISSTFLAFSFSLLLVGLIYLRYDNYCLKGKIEMYELQKERSNHEDAH